jgi:hypothetical protein
MAKQRKPRRNLRASDKALEPYAPEVYLTSQERQEIARQRALNRQADTQAALARPTELTPLQLKRLARSEAKKAALLSKRDPKEPPATS